MNPAHHIIRGTLLWLCLLPSLAVADKIDSLMDGMSDQQKAAQLLLVYHTTADFAAKHQFGGVLIMRNMLARPGRLRSELARLQSQPIGVLVTIDQEGGRVNRMSRLPGWKSVPSAKTLSAWPEAKISALAGRMAKTLADLGINMNLAPVLDPSRDYKGRRTFMGKNRRSFGNEPAIINAKAGAYIRGFQQHGIVSIAKHFPGYDIQTNSDHDIAVSHAPLASVKRNADIFAGLSNQVDGVMISSIHFTAINGRPAVLSKKMLDWARRLNPQAILMTDDLWGTALRSWIRGKGSRGQDAEVLALTRMALQAGNDMLMITHPQLAVKMKRQIANWMKTDAAMRRRVDQAVERVLRLKQRMGLL
jgi:beta-N-acetylhexosaminidase